MSNNSLFYAKKIYMIGIGGVSMSSLAKYLHQQGAIVSGSDISVSKEFLELEQIGLPVGIGHFSERIKEQEVVIYTDAIGEADEELKTARKIGLPCYTRMQLLNAIAKMFPASIAVGGSHGKTSTVSMCAHIMQHAGYAFTAHIGGQDEKFGNLYNNGGYYFLTEACEYKKNLLQFDKLFVAVWLNCEADHMECYQDLDDLRDTFYEYAENAKYSVVNGEDKNITHIPKNAVTFGIGTTFDYSATKISQTGELYSFTVVEYGKPICRVNLKIPGYYHIYNALAATAAMRLCGVEPQAIEKGLQSFRGVKRRFEHIGEWRGAEFVCDYAHHPTEIKKVVEMAIKRCKNSVYVIFQPHTYSRTKLLINDFVDVLSRVENLVVYKTYAAREEYDQEGSAYLLHTQLKNSLYAESMRELVAYLKGNVKSGSLVLFLGAGDIYYVAKQILKSNG